MKKKVKNSKKTVKKSPADHAMCASLQRHYEEKLDVVNLKYLSAARQAESVGETLAVIEKNIFSLMEVLESQGECSLCHADLTSADTLATAAVAHLGADEEGEGSCPIGEIRRALLRREHEDKVCQEFGRREAGLLPGGIILDTPPELGYRCPAGHSYIDWSEFNDHVWCHRCNRDFHYARECVLVEDRHNPQNLPEQPRIIKGVANWTEDGNHFNDVPADLLRETSAAGS